jgi:hypothetical protein
VSKVKLESITFTAGTFSIEEPTWKHKCGTKIPFFPIMDAMRKADVFCYGVACPGCSDLLQFCYEGRELNVYAITLECGHCIQERSTEGMWDRFGTTQEQEISATCDRHLADCVRLLDEFPEWADRVAAYKAELERRNSAVSA